MGHRLEGCTAQSSDLPRGARPVVVGYVHCQWHLRPTGSACGGSNLKCCVNALECSVVGNLGIEKFKENQGFSESLLLLL
jgi:hypothetical protein